LMPLKGRQRSVALTGSACLPLNRAAGKDRFRKSIPF
jgi:hypothetical protein